MDCESPCTIIVDENGDPQQSRFMCSNCPYQNGIVEAGNGIVSDDAIPIEE